MPTIPNTTKCAQLGCKNIRSKINSYCLEHGGLDSIQTDERKAFTSMYQTNHWRSVRDVQLSKQPLCQACLTTGRVSMASHVDHLFKWNALGKEAFYTNIFQSLCTECHSVKSGLEKRGIYRHYTSNGIKDYSLTDYRTVLDKQG